MDVLVLSWTPTFLCAYLLVLSRYKLIIAQCECGRQYQLLSFVPSVRDIFLSHITTPPPFIPQNANRTLRYALCVMHFALLFLRNALYKSLSGG